MFIDRARITIKAGDGGNGITSFIHYKGKVNGGPDGGDGGKGGDVIFVADEHLNNLADYYYTTKFVAENGEAGGSKNCFGRAGKDLVLKVPLGTVIKDRETEFRLKNYKIMHAFGHGVGLEIHELPVLRSAQDNILKENSVIAIEPGVYLPGRFGIRIEDTFQVTRNGCINLTKSGKDYTIIKLL